MDQNITAAPQTSPAPSPAPAPPAAPKPRWSLTLLISVLLLFVLAGFVGSFRATNSDIWMTLAGGRLLADGEYQFGVDPFSWASDGTYWANPTWLGSWLMFAVYQAIGPAALVALKAAMVVVLVGFLFASRSKETPLLPAIEVIALAVITLSARLLLQTAVFSYLGMAILVWMLTRAGAVGGLTKEETKPSGLAWQIPLLFLLWSNLDGLYILGLVALALTTIGVGLTLSGRDLVRQLGIALALSLVACVLNPHFLANLTIPNDLATALPPSWTAAGTAASDLSVGDDSLIPTLSPFSSRALSGFNYNIAGLASYLFFAVSIGSFVAAAFVPQNPRYVARIFLGAGFLLLAAVQIRLVPLYAIVAGPLTVLNLTDYARWSKAAERASKGGVAIATGATFLTLIVAVALAWPGWLHLGLSQFQGDSLFASPRRVDWSFVPDPALKSAVEALGKTTDSDGGAAEEVRVFHTIFDVGHYAAFFAPQIRTGIDLRLSLFAKKAAEYAEVRNALWKEPEPPSQTKLLVSREDTSKLLHKRFADWGVNSLVVAVLPRTFDTRPELIGLNTMRNRNLAIHLISRPDQWTPREADGVALAFVKRSATSPEDPLMLQWRRAAFGVTPADTWLSSDAATVPPREVHWEALYARGVGPRPLEIETAAFQLAMFQTVATGWTAPFYVTTQRIQFAPAMGLAGGGTGVGQALMTAQRMALYEALANVPANRGQAFRAQDLGPPAIPILMHRELRKAVQKNPLLVDGYNHLANAVQLNLEQEDHWARPRVPGVRTLLRQFEMATARRAAINVAPTTLESRLEMIDYLGRNHHLDAVLFERANLLSLLENVTPSEASLKEFFPQIHQNIVAEIRLIDFKRMKVQEPINIHEEFAKRFTALRNNLQERFAIEQKDLAKRRADFELRSSQAKSDLERFRLAVLEPWIYTDSDNKTSSDPRGRGLTLEGIKILERMKPETDTEKSERAYWLIRLYCALGMINEAVETLTAAEKEFHFSQPECNIWVGVCTGFYEMVDKSLAALEKQAAEDIQRRVVPVLDVTLSLNTLALMPLAPRIANGLLIEQAFYPGARVRLDQAIYAQAEFRFLRGLFALERGDASAAGKLVEGSLEGGIFFPDRPIAERYRLLIRQEK